ncbi:NAD(P)/FAD-dependent oxidoreductase [Cellulomonas cellasea]|uniref:Thioredoxin reductase n=1 Tax=Cellulomonas cellasea TaxID=43670 RepID=A0A7W4UDJ7_9CELL|nr:NAD(P)/FAD-dependent oxidoreductase [Cellulomonas cellasea]MBB2922216.1 thioredoxin reductase [Cellulomonas cellasea]
MNTRTSPSNGSGALLDVVVVGGGAAGLSAAVTLGRAHRSVVVVDAGHPRNAPAAHLHGFLSRDGMNPAELLAVGREEVERYGGRVQPGRVVAAARDDDGTFTVTLDDARTLRSRQLVLATGLTDGLPDVPGVAERWGRDVLHCPYCHGWEVSGRAVGILGRGPVSVHQALLWRQWTDDVTLFLEPATELPESAWEELAARGVRVVDVAVERLEMTDDRLTGVRLVDGHVLPVDAVVVGSRMHANAELLAGLGLAVEDVEMQGTVVGSRVPTGPMGSTDVPGLWVAGNTADVSAQVVVAAADGMRTGAAVNATLVAADTRAAVEARRTPFSAQAERELHTRRTAEHPHALETTR